MRCAKRREANGKSPVASDATKQIAGKAPAHAGFDEMAPAAALLALRICNGDSTRLAPCIRGHLVRNAAHGGFCISLPVFLRPVSCHKTPRSSRAC
jgi:hypothetical protein